MSSPDLNLLDRNLAKLIGRCYTPVLPASHFRAQLLQRYRDALRDRTRGIVLPVRPIEERHPQVVFPSRMRFLARVALPLAAAAALIALYLFGFRGASTESRAEILASGAVAWRGQVEEPWQRWDIWARRRLDRERIEFATPHILGVRVEIDARRQFTIGPQSLLVVRTLSDDSASETRTSALQIEFLLERGEVRVRNGEMLSRLTVGVPWILRDESEWHLEMDHLLPVSPADRTEIAITDSEQSNIPEPPAERPPASLSLSVVIGPDSHPARKFDVCLLELTPIPDVRDPKVFNVTSSETGELMLLDLTPGNYALDVAVAGFAPWRESDLRIDAEHPTVITARLKKGLRVHGRVLGPENVPVVGAIVLSEAEAPPQPLAMDIEGLEGQITRMAMTDELGRFELNQLRPGSHIFRASHPDFASGWSPRITLKQDSEVLELLIEMTRGGTVRGRVETDQGLPWVDVNILASRSNVIGEQILMSYRAMGTDEQGRFEINRLPAGHYALLRLNSPDDPQAPLDSEFHLIEIREGQITEFDFLSNFDGVRVYGRLVTNAGAPIPQMGLSILPEKDSEWDDSGQEFALSDSNGAFEFPRVPAGRYAIFLTPDEGMTVVKVDEFELPLVPDFERILKLNAGGVEGLVRDGLTGEPIRNSFVILSAIENPSDDGVFIGRQVTREDGRFFFPNLRENYYRISAQSPALNYGHQTVEEILPRSDGELITLDLFAGGRISVRVLDTKSRPIVGADLQFLDQDGLRIEFGMTSLTDKAGQMRIDGVRPETWTVTATATGYAPRTRICRVATEMTEELEFVLEQLTAPEQE